MLSGRPRAQRRCRSQSALVAADYIAGGDYLGAVSHRDRAARLDKQAADCLVTSFWPLLFSFVLGYGVRIVHTYPHDRSAFTQGLEYHDGLLYEGTGLKGQSTLRVERLETGEVIRKAEVPAEYFGEGITVFGQRIFQLTWQAQVGFIYAKSTFRPLGRFRYTG